MQDLAGGECLGMQVGDFLELERAIHGDGIVNAASGKKEILAPRVFAGQLLALAVEFKHTVQLAGNSQQLAGVHRLLVRGDGFSTSRQPESKQEQSCKLCGK